MKNNRLCAGLALLLCLIAVPVGIRSGANSGMGLHEAALKGDDATVERLLAAGEAVNAFGFLAQTPLHLAAVGGHVAIMRRLLNADADVNASGGLAEVTPLYRAAERGRDAAVLLLIAAGADVNAADSYGCTPLYLAAKRGHEVIAQVLAARGAVPLTLAQCEEIVSGFEDSLRQQKRIELRRLQSLTEQASLERKHAIESTLDEVKIGSERLPRDLKKLIISLSEHPELSKSWREVDLDRLRAVNSIRLPIKALKRIVMFDSPQDIGVFQGMLE